MDPAKQTYSVGELTWYVKHRLENDSVLRDVKVSGEISNLTRHGSGHVYFSMKDEQAQLSCAMFRNVAMRYGNNLPKHGERITVRGQISVYPPRGSYQMIVQSFEREGLGDLHQQFIALRERLKKEGLFDEKHKQAIPRFPRTIGIVTSPTGAVIKDITNTIRRRYPHVKLLLAPTVVQGKGGAASIVGSLQALNAQGNVDVILLARGGGSLEDLWCFNEETVARAIFDSEIPVISGVGHETDVTISDFVADLRAATPSTAAEQAVPVSAEIRAWLDESAIQFKRSLQHFVDIRRQALDDYAFRLESHLKHQVDFKRALLSDYLRRLEQAIIQSAGNRRHQLDVLETELRNLDIREVLKRGYSVTEFEGKRITEASKLKDGDEIVTHYYKGATRSRVENVEEDERN